MSLAERLYKIAEEYDKMIIKVHNLLGATNREEINKALLELKAAHIVADKDMSNLNKAEVFKEDIAKLLKIVGPPETWAGEVAYHVKIKCYEIDKIPKKYIYMTSEERIKKLDEAILRTVRTSIAVSLIEKYLKGTL